MTNADAAKKIRRAYRIGSEQVESDIADNIGACLDDLKSIRVIQDLDVPSVFQAVKLYCFSFLTANKDEAAAFMDRYEALKEHLLTTEEFREPTTEEPRDE